MPPGRRFCGRDSRARSLVLGIGPALLLTLWQNLIMPNMIFRSAMVRAWQALPSAGVNNLQSEHDPAACLLSGRCPSVTMNSGIAGS